MTTTNPELPGASDTPDREPVEQLQNIRDELEREISDVREQLTTLEGQKRDVENKLALHPESPQPFDTTIIRAIFDAEHHNHATAGVEDVHRRCVANGPMDVYQYRRVYTRLRENGDIYEPRTSEVSVTIPDDWGSN